MGANALPTAPVDGAANLVLFSSAVAASSCGGHKVCVTFNTANWRGNGRESFDLYQYDDSSKQVTFVRNTPANGLNLGIGLEVYGVPTGPHQYLVVSHDNTGSVNSGWSNILKVP